jgi:hypothetical protein
LLVDELLLTLCQVLGQENLGIDFGEECGEFGRRGLEEYGETYNAVNAGLLVGRGGGCVPFERARLLENARLETLPPTTELLELRNADWQLRRIEYMIMCVVYLRYAARHVRCFTPNIIWLTKLSSHSHARKPPQSHTSHPT